MNSRDTPIKSDSNEEEIERTISDLAWQKSHMDLITPEIPISQPKCKSYSFICSLVKKKKKEKREKIFHF